MKNKKILAVIASAVMVLTTALPVQAEVIYEQGLPAQEDSSEHLVEVLDPMSDLPAFPGAEGYAKYITGGRGGKVIHVTNLNSSGEGSLYAALDNGGQRDEPRIIVFDVSGTISLAGKVIYSMTNVKNVTIAGQTAPGEGITLTDENFYLKNAENVIIRYIKFRHGQATAKDDSFYVQNSKNIMIDHCSFEYGSDESCSSRNTSNLTIQWSIMTSGVRTHSMGGLQEWNSQTIHHTLLGNQNDRNPKVKGIMDFTNNVLYNWGETPYNAGNSDGNAWGNVVNNYFIAGLDSRQPDYAVANTNGKYFLYLAGNLIDSNKNGVLDGLNTGIDMIKPGSESGKFVERITFGVETPVVLMKNRMAMPELSVVDSAEEAYYKVVNYSGASVYNNTDGTTKLFHDDIDTEILNGVKNQTGKILLHNAESHNEEGEYFTQDFIDNLPSYNVNDPNSEWYRPDADQDGMPDAWETKHGLDPNNAADGSTPAPSGYTWVEEYLNELAAPGFPEENYSYAEEAAANDALEERKYVLRLVDYNGSTKEFEGIYGENQIMVPFAAVAEYLGFNILEETADTVSIECPFALESDLLNIDTKAGILTVRAGDGGFSMFASKASPNEKARTYNDTLYIPVNLVALGMNAVYEQNVEEGNVGVLTVYDAEKYKEWHTGSAVRNTRKVSGPSMIADVADDGIRLLFDKEAALVAGTTAKVTVAVDGVAYTANASAADVWGSHKVAAFKYSDFTDASGNVLPAVTAKATVKVEAGAFADYYNAEYVSVAANSTIDLEAEAAELAEHKATLSPVDTSTGDGSGNEGATEGTTITLRDTIKALYRLLAMKDVNATDYDRIDTGIVDIPGDDDDGDDDDGGDDDGGDDGNVDDDNKDDETDEDTAADEEATKEFIEYVESLNRDRVEKRWQGREGWQMVFGEWYYFNEEGTLKLGWVQDTDDRWYYMNNDGSLAYGWVLSEESGLWYYMNLENGDMLTDQWLCDPESGRWYYLDKNGAMCTGWNLIDGTWYLLDKNGAMCTDWNLVDGYWYFLGTDGKMLKGWQQIRGKFYYMNEKGQCLINTTTPDGYKVDETGARIN